MIYVKLCSFRKEEQVAWCSQHWAIFYLHFLINARNPGRVSTSEIASQEPQRTRLVFFLLVPGFIPVILYRRMRSSGSTDTDRRGTILSKNPTTTPPFYRFLRFHHSREMILPPLFSGAQAAAGMPPLPHRYPTPKQNPKEKPSHSDPGLQEQPRHQ